MKRFEQGDEFVGGDSPDIFAPYIDHLIESVAENLINDPEEAARCYGSDSFIVSGKGKRIIYSRESSLKININKPRNNSDKS